MPSSISLKTFNNFSIMMTNNKSNITALWAWAAISVANFWANWTDCSDWIFCYFWTCGKSQRSNFKHFKKEIEYLKTEHLNIELK